MDKTLEGQLALRFEIGFRLYFGIVPWFGQNNSDGEKSERDAVYVKNNLKPVDVQIVEGTEKHWYWWKYLDEDCHVNYRNCNDEYIHLFEDKYFEDYITKACCLIDAVVNSIPTLKRKI